MRTHDPGTHNRAALTVCLFGFRVTVNTFFPLIFWFFDMAFLFFVLFCKLCPFVTMQSTHHTSKRVACEQTCLSVYFTRTESLRRHQDEQIRPFKWQTHKPLGKVPHKAWRYRGHSALAAATAAATATATATVTYQTCGGSNYCSSAKASCSTTPTPLTAHTPHSGHAHTRRPVQAPLLCTIDAAAETDNQAADRRDAAWV